MLTEVESRELLRTFLIREGLTLEGWSGEPVQDLGWYFYRPGVRSSFAIAIAQSRRMRSFPTVLEAPEDVLEELNKE